MIDLADADKELADDNETKFVELPEEYRDIEVALRSALKRTTSPLIDGYIQQALWWLSQCESSAIGQSPSTERS